MSHTLHDAVQKSAAGSSTSSSSSKALPTADTTEDRNCKQAMGASNDMSAIMNGKPYIYHGELTQLSDKAASSCELT